MKTPSLILLIWSVVILAGTAAEPRTLSEAESKALIERAKLAQAAFDTHDIDSIISFTHPVIYKFAPREQFREMLAATLEEFGTEMKIEKAEWGTPSPVHRDGETEVCFVPKVSTINVRGTRVRRTGYWIAARGPDAPEWLFLDSANVVKRPELLWVVFPGLPRDVQTPPTKVQPIND